MTTIPFYKLEHSNSISFLYDNIVNSVYSSSSEYDSNIYNIDNCGNNIGNLSLTASNIDTTSTDSYTVLISNSGNTDANDYDKKPQFIISEDGTNYYGLDYSFYNTVNIMRDTNKVVSGYNPRGTKLSNGEIIFSYIRGKWSEFDTTNHQCYSRRYNPITDTFSSEVFVASNSGDFTNYFQYFNTRIIEANNKLYYYYNQPGASNTDRRILKIYDSTNNGDTWDFAEDLSLPHDHRVFPTHYYHLIAFDVISKSDQITILYSMYDSTDSEYSPIYNYTSLNGGQSYTDYGIVSRSNKPTYIPNPFGDGFYYFTYATLNAYRIDINTDSSNNWYCTYVTKNNSDSSTLGDNLGYICKSSNGRYWSDLGRVISNENENIKSYNGYTKGLACIPLKNNNILTASVVGKTPTSNNIYIEYRLLLDNNTDIQKELGHAYNYLNATITATYEYIPTISIVRDNDYPIKTCHSSFWSDTFIEPAATYGSPCFYKDIKYSNLPYNYNPYLYYSASYKGYPEELEAWNKSLVNNDTNYTYSDDELVLKSIAVAGRQKLFYNNHPDYVIGSLFDGISLRLKVKTRLMTNEKCHIQISQSHAGDYFTNTGSSNYRIEFRDATTSCYDIISSSYAFVESHNNTIYNNYWLVGYATPTRTKLKLLYSTDEDDEKRTWNLLKTFSTNITDSTNPAQIIRFGQQRLVPEGPTFDGTSCWKFVGYSTEKGKEIYQLLEQTNAKTIIEGEPLDTDYEYITLNGMKLKWDGLDGYSQDKWDINWESTFKAENMLSKDNNLEWRSKIDSTTDEYIIFDSTLDDLGFYRGNLILLDNMNFRKCKIQAQNTDATDWTSPAIDIELDTLYEEMSIEEGGQIGDNYIKLDSSYPTDALKNYNVTIYSPIYPNHYSYKIKSNSGNVIHLEDNITIQESGGRAIIFHNKYSYKFDDIKSYRYWRIYIPSQISDINQNKPYNKDGVYYRIGKFDLGILSEYNSQDNIESNYSYSYEYNNTETVGELNNKYYNDPDLITENYNLGFKYITKENIDRIESMFYYLQNNNLKTWFFMDQEAEPYNFDLYKMNSDLEKETVIVDEAYNCNFNITKVY